MNPTDDQVATAATAAYAEAKGLPLAAAGPYTRKLWLKIARAALETLPLLTLEELVAELRKAPSGYAIRYDKYGAEEGGSVAFLGGAVYGTPEEAEKDRVTLGTYTTVVGIVEMK